MSLYRTSLISRLLGRLNLRFPTLFLIFVILTLLDLVLPDPIPFVDEIALAVLALLFGTWKRRREPRTLQGTVGR
jgi:hypothetical protein